MGFQGKEIKDSGPDPKARVATSTILNSKCVRLLEEMIADSGYADISLPDDMRKGFNLLGDIPSSNVLPRKATYASISLQDLRSTAKDNQDSTIAIAEGSCKSEEDFLNHCRRSLQAHTRRSGQWLGERPFTSVFGARICSTHQKVWCCPILIRHLQRHREESPTNR